MPQSKTFSQSIMKRTKISPSFEIRLNRTLQVVREDQKRNCIVFFVFYNIKKKVTTMTFVQINQEYTLQNIFTK